VSAADPYLAHKRHAALQAAALLAPGMVVGLGSGRTAELAVQAAADRYRSGALAGIVCISTSRRTQELAQAAGLPMSTLDDHLEIDLTIDGADEIDPSGDLIKGGGGALLHEKLVASASMRFVVVADPGKLVDRLGTTRPLPVEVSRFGWKTHLEAIRRLGGKPHLREGPAGEPFLTDEGHYVLDCGFAGGIDDPEVLDVELKARTGVIETGLFLGMADDIIIGEPSETGEGPEERRGADAKGSARMKRGTA
jgi:ribose 5-phosphate isomerase A